MGNCSCSFPHLQKVHIANTAPYSASANWKRKLSKKEALELYVEDGTLPANCSDELLELRAFVDDPLMFRGLAQFAIQSNMLPVLMCWIEVLEYKHINESSVEYQMGKGLDIYHKYIESAEAPSYLRSNLNVSIADAIVSGAALSSHLYDEFLQLCLQHIYTSLYVPYKETEAYVTSTRQARQSYNRVCVEDFEYFEVLGQGGFGLVVHCKKKSTGKHYALKIQTKTGLLENFSDHPARVVLEREAASHCHHNFIVSMDYAFQSESLAFMVVELGRCGTLADAMSHCDNRMMPEERVVFYSAEIILAISHIHRLGMIYRDLKPANVLLCEDGHIKMVDLGSVIDVGGEVFGSSEGADTVFERQRYGSGQSGGLQMNCSNTPPNTDNLSPLGCNTLCQQTKSLGLATASGSHDASRRNSDGLASSEGSGLNEWVNGAQRTLSIRKRNNSLISAMPMATSVMGTLGYMAPEMAIILYSRRNNGYSHCVDYWSLGVMMFEMLTSSLPFHHSIVSSFMGYVPKGTSEVVNAVTAELACPSSRKRRKHDVNIYAPEVTKHPALMAAFFRLDALKTVSTACKSVIARFLEVDEDKRLGSGSTGLHDIKRQVVFEGLDWDKLTQKLVSPPYLPDLLKDPVVKPHVTFTSMIEACDKASWLQAPADVQDHFYFENWDWISPSILKAELGIVQQSEQGLSNTFQLKHFFEMPSYSASFISQRVSSEVNGMNNASNSYSNSIEPKRRSLASQSKEVISTILKNETT